MLLALRWIQIGERIRKPKKPGILRRRKFASKKRSPESDIRAITTIAKMPFFKDSSFRAMVLPVTLILCATFFGTRFAPKAELPAYSLTYIAAVLRYSLALAEKVI